MTRWIAAWAVAGCYCLLPTASVADEINGTRTATVFVERTNLVRATLHEGYVRLDVQRSFENQSLSVDEAQWVIDVPELAVATGLRTQGNVGGMPVWYDGTLLPVGVAAARYRYLTGYGQVRLRDAALLYWISSAQLGLQVFPCAPNEPKTVGYTLHLPMKYEGGRYRGIIETMGTADLPATVELRSAVKGAMPVLDGIELRNNATGIRRERAEGISVELRPNAAQPISAELAVADLLTGRAYVRAELRAAPRISSIPTGAKLVFIFDQSRSMGATWEAQKDLFEQLVSQFPKAQVHAVGFDRVVRSVTNGFVSVARAKELVAALPVETRNGSRVDLALAAVKSMLAKHHAQRKDTRVFLLTDALHPSVVTTSAISRQITEVPALAHVADVFPSTCHLLHFVEHEWREAIESTGGATWQVDIGKDDCRSVLEELARPKRYFLQTLTLVGSLASIELPESLDEGEAFEYEVVVGGNPKSIVLEAKLWGKPVTKRWGPNPRATRIRAAFASTRYESYSEVTDAERLRLAMLGGAVSPLTSYLAVEPGVRPSTPEYEEGGGRRERIVLGSIGTAAHGPGIGTRERFDPQSYIEGVVDRIRRQCEIGSQRVTVEVETSLQELLDVVRVEVPDSPPSASDCLSANLWEEELPIQFDKARARYVVVR